MAAPLRVLLQRISHLSTQRFTAVITKERQPTVWDRFHRQLGFRKYANTTHSRMLSTNYRMQCVTLHRLGCSVSRNDAQSYGVLQMLPKWVPAEVVKRQMTTGLTDDMVRKEMDKLTDRFMEAKELLDDARESAGSVYFNEDLQEADQAVEETLADYKVLLSRLDDAQRQSVTRSIGLKMEELSAQQKMIRESLKD